MDRDTLAVAISQSGETADTLAAFREAKRLGALPLGICNVQGSMLTREAAGTLLTHAGPEIGVASTKAFTSQLVALSLLALHLGRLRGTLSADRCRQLLQELAKRAAPDGAHAAPVAPQIEELARTLAQASDFLFLGRGINYPIALEGALKLKEISYIHAEGYPAGEMKHGPIALIDERLPVVALCPPGRTYEKMLSNVQEVKARGGRVLAVAAEGDTQLAHVLERHDVLLQVPAVEELWSPLLMVVPLQLLAYHVAVRAGPRRRPAAQPGQVGDGRVSSAEPPVESPLLAGLNPQQREAVLAAEGAVLILAGRGQRQDARDHAPHRPPGAASAASRPAGMLAVTFTNKAAGEMRARVERLLRGHVRDQLDLHVPQPSACAFCAGKRRRPACPRDFLIYDDDDQMAAVREAMRELDLSEKLHPPRRLLSRISAAKNLRRETRIEDDDEAARR